METEKSLLILGGTSDIGRAVAIHYATRGWRVLLAGRDPVALERTAADIGTRTASNISIHALDILQTEQFPAFLDSLGMLPHTVVCVIGMLGDQRRAETDPSFATTVMRSNYEGPAILLSLIAERFAARGWGTIVGVSSVAGDRGRASNYVYGSAKSGFTAFLSGLRNRLVRTNIQVITVKPGFVRTRMTADMKLPKHLTAAPEEVATAVYTAEMRKRDIVYVRPIWRLVMSIIGTLPESVFKKTRF